MSDRHGDDLHDGGDARRRFLERVRAAVAAHPGKSAAPDYPDEIAFARSTALAPDDRVPRFRERLEAAHGRVFTDAGALADWLAAQGARHGYCDPLLLPAVAAACARAVPGPVTLETALDRARIDDYRFGITRAAGAIAETGTIILDDALTSRRLAALAPWIHVAVLSPEGIHAHVADAIGALGADPNVIWCTGPSKTADVEGILIEGVHGPGEQLALIVAL